MKRRLFSSFCISLILGGQLGLTGVAWADEATPTPTPSDTPVVTPTASPDPTPSPTVTPDPTPTTSPSPSPTPTVGPTGPTGPQGTTGPDSPTGTIPDWVLDVAAGKWVEADKSSFIYDKASGYWLSPKYSYDKRSGYYEILPPQPAGTPQPDYILTAPKVVHTSMGDLTIGSPEYQLARIMGVIDANGQPTGSAAIGINGTGAGSTNQASITGNDQTWMDLTNLVNVINILQSQAKSGDVAEMANTQAGDAVSGAASVIANLINLLASAWSWANGNLNFFMQNIGDLDHNLVLAPSEDVSGGGSQLGGSADVSNTGDGSTNQATIGHNSDLNVNAQNDGSITNNVDLLAQSGDAVARQNSEAGNVKTGDAFAGVNIINLINSFINSGSSFFGILNIWGTMTGNILFPPGFLDGLLGSQSSDPNAGMTAGIANTGANSNNQVGVSNDSQTDVTNTSAYGLNNNVNTTAQSGAVNLDGNSTTGLPNSGAASTTNGLFNLVNTSIFGDNAVLVIVNVLGHWVGRIMNVPGGNTMSALLTGNAQVDTAGAGSTNQANVSNTDHATINQANTGTITNNVNVHAQSGDATAAENTAVGTAQTGQAKASSNVANIVNSALNVRHWFGVLVINVFGDWFGNVNDNTPVGGMGAMADGSLNETAAPAASSPAVVTAASSPAAVAQVENSPAVSNLATDAVMAAGGTGAVLAAAAHTAGPVAGAAAAANLNWLFIGSAVLMLLAGAFFSAEQKLRRRQ